MKTKKRTSNESGQVIPVVLLVLAIFLLGSLAFAVDMGFMWWHRQTAQNAADAACIAGAMDLLVYNQSPNASTLFPWIANNRSSGFDCDSHTDLTNGYGPCQYAARNSYDSNGSTPGNSVYVSFPASLPGVATTPPSTLAAVPFMRVDVLDHVQTFFWGLLSGATHADVRAFANCGTVQITAPVPILVLRPGAGTLGACPTCTLNLNGGATTTILGGPSQSVQVNSSDPAAVQISSNTTVDLTHAGPNNNGADFGIWGNGSISSRVSCGSGDPVCWKPGTTPISDPFAYLTAVRPAYIGTTGAVGAIPNGTSGCAGASSGSGYTNCTEYKPGYWANGICITSGAAVFDPGIYYLDNVSPCKPPSPGLYIDNGSCVRPSTIIDTNSNGLDGTVFIFANGASLTVQSGANTKCDPTKNFNVSTGGLSGHGVFCSTLPSPMPTGIPATISGNVFLGPCTSPVGTPYGGDRILGDPSQRGMLFFHDHTIIRSTQQPQLQGGGTYAASGIIYFHATDYSDIFTLNGGSASGSFAYGDIVVDQLTGGGGSGIAMYLSPSRVSAGVLKATLLQ
jgi:Putative Flp pilus-assembly TadE/G-like